MRISWRTIVLALAGVAMAAALGLAAPESR
jgi:hypothetical protein